MWSWISAFFERPPAIKASIIMNNSAISSSNRAAFLTTIAVSEGTENLGYHGYNVLFGGALFSDYKDHPRKEILVPRLGIETTAAGRYQILERTFDSYKKLLNLPDFSPSSQDTIALQLTKERNALGDIDAGRVSDAVQKCSNIWASFEGNNYHQPTNSAAHLSIVFTAAGGRLST